MRLRATLRTRLDAQVSEIVALTQSGTVRSTTTSDPLSLRLPFVVVLVRHLPAGADMICALSQIKELEACARHCRQGGELTGAAVELAAPLILLEQRAQELRDDMRARLDQGDVEELAALLKESKRYGRALAETRAAAQTRLDVAVTKAQGQLARMATVGDRTAVCSNL